MLFVPGMGGRGGMTFLPNGDLAMVTGSEEAVRIIHPNGSSEPPWTFFTMPYGVIADESGMLYIADRSYLYRVDPADGQYDILLSSDDIPNLRTITFDADYGSLFIASGYAPDMIYRAYLDGQGNIDPPMEWGTIGVSWLDEPYIDGLQLDACGNLYAAEFFTNNMYKIGPDGGQAEVFVDWDETDYGHALEWGSGIGGFSSTALYLPRPYANNTVVEVELGVPSAHD
jgi:streptogramin lyase